MKDKKHDAADNHKSSEDTALSDLTQDHHLDESTKTQTSRLGQLVKAGYSVPKEFVFADDNTHPDKSVFEKSDAEYTGVMFTEHPNSTGLMLVELISGASNTQGFGNTTPGSYTFGKLTAQLVIEMSSVSEQPPIELTPLLDIGRELENLLERPQDIEWAYAKGKYFLLQARDVTRSASDGTSLRHMAERERGKLLSTLSSQHKHLRGQNDNDVAEPVYVQNDVTRQLPRPTPLSADLLSRVYAAGGSVDLACQQLGIPYKTRCRDLPYINTIFGWTYVNTIEEKQRLGKGPGAIATYKLSRYAASTRARFSDDFLPAFQTEMIERNAISMERLTLEASTDLLGIWVKRFVEKTWLESELISTSATFHYNIALEQLKAARLEPSEFLDMHKTSVVDRTAHSLNQQRDQSASLSEFVLMCGHRAPVDFELAAPRFSEDMNLTRRYMNSLAQSNSAQDVEDITDLPDGKALTTSLQKARDFLQLKEQARHFCLIELSQIRRLLVAIDNRLHLDGRIFQLKISEIDLLADPAERARLINLADERFEASMVWKSLQLPESLSIFDLERMDFLTGTYPDIVAHGDLAGKRVAGDQDVVGTVRVITDVDQINTVAPGDILVTRVTDHAWYPFFAKAQGIVTEVGGWLSHTAIAAREYNLAAIVGVDNACQRLNSGDVVRMSMSGSLEILSERRSPRTSLRAASANAANQHFINAAGENNADLPVLYQMKSRRLFKYSQSIERRAMKERVTDRRKQPRYSESGELLTDRRHANRLANAKNLRKTG